jgi:HEAT repeat protein
MKNEEVVDAIIARLSREKDDIGDGTAGRESLEAVANMIRALRALGDPKALTPIITVLTAVQHKWGGGVEAIRHEGLRALGEMGGEDEDAIYEIISYLQVPDAQNSAFEAVKDIGDPASKYLIGMLDSDESYIQKTALSALAAIGSKEAVNDIVPLLKEDDVQIAGNAALTLATLCR